MPSADLADVGAVILYAVDSLRYANSASAEGREAAPLIRRACPLDDAGASFQRRLGGVSAWRETARDCRWRRRRYASAIAD